MFVKNGSRVPEGFESFTEAAKNLGRWDILKAWTIGAEDTEEKLRMLLGAYDSVKKEYPAFTLKFIVNETKRHSNNHAGESQRPEK